MAVNGLRNNIPEAAFQRLRGDPAGACRANRVTRQSVIAIRQGKYSLSLEWRSGSRRFLRPLRNSLRTCPDPPESTEKLPHGEPAFPVTGFFR